MKNKAIFFALNLLLALGACNEQPENLQDTETTTEQSKDRFRPKLHFTPAKNWMNDPNGMFFYDGEYHLYYQHNPYGNTWGHMSWGHAVSTDMITWEHLPVALEEEDGVMIFSGSAVVDWNNTSGFGKDSEPAVVAIYTSYDANTNLQHQSIAYSNDKGRSFTKYEGNPILDLGLKDFRDPKVFWYEEDKKWVMSVALSAARKIQFYESQDLKKWELLSDFGPYGATGGVWECPDLFPLTTPEGETKWILQVDLGDGSIAGGSGGQYFVGDFDGTTYTSEVIPKNIKKAYVPEGNIIEDFEGDLSFWTVDGEAFGNLPTNGGIKDQQEVKGHLGNGFLNSFHGGDAATGNLVSKKFTIDKNYINLLIGGGSKSGVAEVALIVQGDTVKLATGNNSEPLTWAIWNVADLNGKEGHLAIYDNAKDGWGHINVDHIIQSNEQAYNLIENANWLDYGKDFYAAVSWSDVTKEDGRRLWLGWMNNWQYANEIPTGKVWRSHMSIPREIQLRKNNEGYYLVQQVVEELDEYKKNTQEFNATALGTLNTELQDVFNGMEYELNLVVDENVLNEALEFKIDSEGETAFAFEIEKSNDGILLRASRPKKGNIDFNSKFVFHNQEYHIQNSDLLTVKIIVDKSSVEVFVNEGNIIFTNLIFPKSNKISTGFYSKDPNAQIQKLSSNTF